MSLGMKASGMSCSELDRIEATDESVVVDRERPRSPADRSKSRAKSLLW